MYRALERDPKNRYASAREFARDLTHLDQVGVTDRRGIARMEKAANFINPRELRFLRGFALIPIAIFGLMLYFANR